MTESTREHEAIQGGCLFALLMALAFLIGVVAGPSIIAWLAGVCR